MANEQKSKSNRYKLIKQVGAGDFAKVFSAEDKKLGRKVAIKQLHAQYLDDEEKLERYWQEAKLLLDLEHPNIMTIYDVVKTKGRLILELMQGSLRQVYGSKPMPVDDVRQTIRQAAKGLSCLHKNGIIHGDIKPANLMLSRTNTVKLGDFGLARRANDDQGSMLKGTTKYMAPELVSEDFGAVGPQSDLYSLGFSALELMVGPDFDSLFPDLVAFGRDKQMAWMMWHCSADRQLPVKTVLEGVPEDVANVIEKLTKKDQSKRYKSAQEVIADLSGNAREVGVSLKEEQAAAEAAAKKKKRNKRLFAAAACFSSLLLSGLILYLMQPKPEPEARVAPPPVQGVVKNVLPFDEKFVVEVGTDWKEYTLIDKDVVKLNRKIRQLRDLEPGDRVVVNTHLSDSGPDSIEIIAFRPERHSGVITEIKPDSGQFLMTVDGDGADAGSKFELFVNEETSITVNEQEEVGDVPMGLADLKTDDVIEVKLSDDLTGMVALKVDAIRQVKLEGTIRDLLPALGSITIADTSGAEEKLVTLELSPACTFSLNDQKSVDEKLLGPRDIRIGDRVTVQHDIKITNIDAYRPFEDKGTIRSVAYDGDSFILKSQNATKPRSYRIGANTQVLLGKQTVSIGELRAGDEAELVHDSPDSDSPVLLALTVQRPKDRTKWAILIGNQKFDDNQVKPLKTPIANLSAIKDKMLSRFGVREEQVKVFEDESLVTLEQEIPDILGRLGARDQLFVYCATRGFVEKGKGAYLAAKDFLNDDIAGSGMKLDWLIDELDNCASEKKVLFLECPSDSASGDEGPASASEMVKLLQDTKAGGYPKYTYVLANAQPGDQTVDASDTSGRSGFGDSLTKAFAGEADRERDGRVEITELSGYVVDEVTSLANSKNQKQSPVLFTPDDRPPRLSQRNKEDIISLLTTFSQTRLDSKVAEQVINTGFQLSAECNEEPEPMLATGIILIKFFKMKDALEILEQVRLKHRDCLLAHQGVIFVHLYKKHYDEAGMKLREMLDQIPLLEEGQKHTETVKKKFAWAGSVRELIGSAKWNKRLPDASVLEECDKLVARHGKEYETLYQEGRVPIRDQAKAFVAQIETGKNVDETKLKQARIRSYDILIATPGSIQEIREALDSE